MSTIQVAREGNRRVGGLSHDELEQCVLDIRAWLQRAGCKGGGGLCAPSRGMLEDIEDACDATMPDGLRALLMAQDSSDVWLHEYRALPAEVVLKTAESLRGTSTATSTWRGGLIPMARDVDGRLLVCDASSSDEGTVLEWDPDSGDAPPPCSEGEPLGAYLEAFRDGLLSGHFEFIDDVGVVEAVGGGRGK